jgi:hypothetical protein
VFPRSRAGPDCRGVTGSENRGRRTIASDGTPIILGETAAVCLLVRRGWLISVVEQSRSRSGPHFSKRRSVAGGHSRRFGLCQSVRSGRTSSLIEKTSPLGQLIRRCYQKTVRSEIGSDHFRQPENSVACITQHHPASPSGGSEVSKRSEEYACRRASRDRRARARKSDKTKSG